MKISIQSSQEVLGRASKDNRAGAPLKHFIPEFEAPTDNGAYWIGFLMADGNIYKDRVSLALGAIDIDHLKKFQTFTKIQGNIYERKASNTWRYEFWSVLTVNSLARYGVVPNKTHTARVEELEINRHFWRGVIDGDGYIRVKYDGRKWGVNIDLTGSRPLVEQFLLYSKPFIANSTASMRAVKKSYRIHFNGRPALSLIYDLYHDAETSLSRKQEIANVAILNRDEIWNNMTRGKKLLTADQEREVLRLYSEGNSSYAIAREFNVDRPVIGRVLDRAKRIDAPPGRVYRTREEMDAIIKDFLSGKSPVKIANELGCSSDSVRGVLRRNGIM